MRLARPLFTFSMLAIFLSGLGGFIRLPEAVLARTADPVFVGAGDIASCGWTRDEATAKLLDNVAGTVFTLGDNVYPDGTTTQFNDCYSPTWGRHKNRTKPATGNHDYNTAGAAGYYTYFGAAASPLDTNCTSNCKGYYSFNLGSWHIIALNSEIDHAAGSPQENWLRADLAGNPQMCTLAYWHKPRFSSGAHGNNSSFQPFWQALYDYGADVVLNGHDHTYERFAPQSPTAQAAPTRGIREFIVGTGGAGLYVFSTIQPNSEVRNNSTWGVLKLTLHATSYNWEFVPIAGQTFTDAGSSNCVNAGPTPTFTPTATDIPSSTPVSPTPTFTPKNVDVTIGGTLQGSYYVFPDQVVTASFANLQNGPVKVKSRYDTKLFTSQRVISGNSFNEVMGYPTEQLTTDYWFPWYDNLSMITWVMVGNPTGSTANVDIYIGGVKRGSYTIPAGGRITPRFNLQTGPVRVVSTNGVKIFTSERALYKGAFNEVMGYPANQFSTEYWYPWYDNLSMATWILVGNPSTTSTASVDIYVGGVKQSSYTIPKGQRITPRFNINPTGPVRVVSTNGVKLFSSERTVAGDSFNEVMGYPANQLTTEYWFPWYNNVSMADWVLVGNPSTTSTAAVDIYVGGVKRGSYTIPPNGRVTPRFNLQTGPVRVRSTNGVKIFASQRVLYGTSFNEVMGYPANQFSTEYWFPWYDSTTMSTDILVGMP